MIVITSVCQGKITLGFQISIIYKAYWFAIIHKAFTAENIHHTPTDAILITNDITQWYLMP